MSVLRDLYAANAERTTAARLIVPILSSKHQSGRILWPLLVNGRPRLEQFPGDLIEMV